METINFNERLKELRQEVGLTQTALASEIGATQRQVSFWEKGQIEPNIFWLNAFAPLNKHCIFVTFGNFQSLIS